MSILLINHMQSASRLCTTIPLMDLRGILGVCLIYPTFTIDPDRALKLRSAVTSVPDNRRLVLAQEYNISASQTTVYPLLFLT